MSRKHRQGIIAGTSVVLVCLLIVGVRLRQAQTQQADEAPPPPDMPRLFALSYAEGHGLAGFAGRPIVLVFTRAGTPGVAEFLEKCEADPVVSELLRTTYVGAVVDMDAEPDVASTYRVAMSGRVLVKDLRGPILGVLEGNLDPRALGEILSGKPLGPGIGRSPLYERLLQGPAVLDEFVEKGFADEAARAVRFLRRLEPSSDALGRAEARARELGLDA